MAKRYAPRILPLTGAAFAALAGYGLSPALADTDEAEEASAADLYREGQAAAQEGDWEEALDAWKSAYEIEPSSVILFSIGQAYRSLDECESALYVFEEYLAEDEAQFREMAEEGVLELEGRCEPASPWPEPDPSPTDDNGNGNGNGEGDDTDDNGGVGENGPTRSPVKPEPGAARSPKQVVVTAEAGPSLGGFGDRDVGVLSAFRLAVSHPIDLGDFEVQAGAATAMTPIPWRSGGESGTALLTGLVASGAARYPLLDELFLRGELGLGAQILSGIADSGTMFIDPGLTVTGALTLFHMRAQLGAEYEITPDVAISASPVALSFSPHRSGIHEEIGSILRFESLVGLTLRL